MKAPFIPLFLALLLSLSTTISRSQDQIQIEIDHFGSNYSSSPTFNDRYNRIYHTFFSPGKPAYYKSKKVKQIRIYDQSNQLTWMADLDSSGKTIRTGVKGVHYFITEETPPSADSFKITTCNYYEGNQLLRTDSTFRTQVKFTSRDTTFIITQTLTRCYKKGNLINEQNKYYNSLYRNFHIALLYKYMEKRTLGKIIKLGAYALKCQEYRIISRYRDGNTGRINTRLRKNFKTSYDTTRLYLCSTVIYTENIKAKTDTNEINISYERYPSKQFKPITKQNTTKFITQGEDFHQASKEHENYYCGYARGRDNYAYEHTSYHYTDNDKGLHQTYYSTYTNEENKKSSYQLFTFEYLYYE